MYTTYSATPLLPSWLGRRALLIFGGFTPKGTGLDGDGNGPLLVVAAWEAIWSERDKRLEAGLCHELAALEESDALFGKV